jgi:polysaccharide biosynthesis transport protein
METPKLAGVPDSRQHFLDYWRIVRLRKVIIFAVFFLVLITATAVTFVLQPVYSSTAKMRVERDSPDIILPGSMAQPNYDFYYYSTEIEIFKSEIILLPVIRELKLADKYTQHYKSAVPFTTQEAFEQLVRDVDIRPDRNTSLIDISVMAWDPKLAAEIANRIAMVYRDERDRGRSGKSSRGMEALTNEVVQLQKEVEEQTRVVDKMKRDLKVPDIVSDGGTFQSLSAQELQKLQGMQTELRVKVSQLETEVLRLSRLTPKERRHALNYSHSTSALQSLMVDLSAAEQKRSSLVALGENHPDLKKANDVLKTINEQVDLTVAGIMQVLEGDLEIAKKNLTLLGTALEETRDRDNELSSKWRPYLQAKKELESKEKRLNFMQMQMTQQHMDTSVSRQSSVLIVNEAKPALRPIKPKKVVNITLGAMAGLLLGVSLAFFIEYLDTSVKTIDDVEQALGCPVLGVIPQNVSSLLEEGEEGPHAEAYRVLRTNILFSRKNAAFTAMTVVSGGAGEGKSTTIFNLAVVFAQQGSRVLLVDSDLRRPSLHRKFNIENKLGLTSFLLKQNTLEEVVVNTAHPLLHFLPSGKLPSSSMGILNSSAMRAFIEEAKKRYDFVLFDSPPIMGVSDASILASEVDLAMLVVQYRKYPQQMTLRAKQMVEKVGGRLVGVVLNNINISQDSYYYYYSGYYYGDYSKSPDSTPESESRTDAGKASVSKRAVKEKV